MGTKEAKARGRKAPGKGSSWIRSLGPIGGLVAILAIPAGGYAFYVIDQLREVEEQNLRTLAKAAGTVESLVENFRSNVESLAGEPSYGCEFQRRQSRLRLVHPQKCEDIAAPDAPDYKADAEIESGAEGLIFTVPIESEDNDSEDKDAADAKDQGAMVWAIRFDRVLTEIPFGGGMNVLLIADRSGRVVKQHPDPTASPASGNGADELQDFSGVGLSERGVRIDDLKKIRPLEGETKLSDELGYGSTIQTVLIAGEGYRMLCQPLVLSLPDSEDQSAERKSWVLCGLVEERQALQDALEVAPFLTVSLFALFFFSLFLWPVAKILTLSPRERFRFADVYLLLLGTWGALMLATILVVTLDTYGEFKDQAAYGLEQLADDVERNLSAELGEIHSQLRAYDLELDSKLTGWLEKRNDSDARLEPGNPPSYILPKDIVDRTSLLNVDLPVDAETGNPVYPFFSSLYWIEPCSGQQIAKGAVRRKNTPRVNVSQRAYFQRVQEDRLWQLPGTAGPSDRYHLQTDRSLTTGEFFAALSTASVITDQPATTDAGEEDEDSRSTLERYWGEFADPVTSDPDASYQGVIQSLVKRHGRCGASPQAVTVMSGQLTSITNPVLAPGAGFAILDSSGNVIFHSDERRAKFENLFEEVSDGERLKSILRAGIASRLNTKYRAQPHQVFARPMQQLPWSVVTFLDDEVLRTSFLESLMHSVMLMLSHLALYFLATLVYLALWGRSSPVWMWPYLSDRASDYRWLAWMLLVILLGTGLVIHNLDDENLLFIGLLVPLVPIIVASVGPIMQRQKRDGRFVRNVIAGTASLAAILCLTVPLRQAEHQSLSSANYVLVIALIAVWLPGALAALAKLRPASSYPRPSVTGGERRNALTAYIVTAVLMWAVIAILPAYGYAKIAVNDQIGVLVKYENQTAARRIAARADVIHEYYLQVDMKQDYVGKRLQLDQEDIYWFWMYWQRDVSRFSAHETSESQREMKPLQSSYPWRELAGFLPIYNETSRDMRYFQQTVDDEDERWMVDGDGNVEFQAIDPAQGTKHYLRSQPSMAFPALGKPTVLAAALMFMFVSFWSRYGARKIFFGDITPGSSGTEKGKQSWGRIEALAESAPDFRVFSPRRGLNKKVGSEWLMRELETIRNLDELIDVDKDELLQRFGTRKEVLDHINELIEPIYDAEWKLCSGEERLVLVQLAQEGVANPKQERAVRSLIERGLLFKDPALRIVNQSFALFASSRYAPDEVKRKEGKHDGLNWASTQKMLFAAIVLLLVFLITTQPAAVESLTKFFTGTAASVVAIISLANKFSGLRGGGGS